MEQIEKKNLKIKFPKRIPTRKRLRGVGWKRKRKRKQTTLKRDSSNWRNRNKKLCKENKVLWKIDKLFRQSRLKWMKLMCNFTMQSNIKYESRVFLINVANSMWTWIVNMNLNAEWWFIYRFDEWTSISNLCKQHKHNRINVQVYLVAWQCARGSSNVYRSQQRNNVEIFRYIL